MLVFLGDFKPDYLDPTLPFEADDYPIVNLDCAISDSDDERASKAYSIIVKLQVLDALSNYSLTMVSVASTERTGANLDRSRCNYWPTLPYLALQRMHEWQTSPL